VFKERVLAGRIAGLGISVCIEVRELHELFQDEMCADYDRAMSHVINVIVMSILVPIYERHGGLHGICDANRLESLRIRTSETREAVGRNGTRPGGCKRVSKTIAHHHSRVMWKIKRDLKRSLMTTGHALNDEEYLIYQSAVLMVLSSIYANVIGPLGEVYPDIVATEAQYMSISP